MTRLRRIPPRGLFRRKRYDVRFERLGEPIRVVTTLPVVIIDKHLGVGDAWSLVHAADDAWSGEAGDWVTLRADG